MRYLLVLILLSFHLIADDNLTKVSLQLKWKHQFQFAGFYVAKAKGFYREVGIDAEIKEFDVSMSVVEDVVRGVSDFGVDDSQLIYYRLQNKPIQVVMAIFQQSPLTILTTTKHNITTLDDFDGKTLEFTDKLTYETPVNTLLSARGIEAKKVQPSFSLENLIAHKVDGVLAYTSNEPYVLQKMGYQAKMFTPKDYGIEAYGDMLFSSTKFIQQSPQLVEKFSEASQKGWEYAFNHIDETVDIIYQHYNTQNKTKEALRYEANVLKELSGIETGEFGKLDAHRFEINANSFSILFPSKYDLDLLKNFIHYPKISLNPKEKEYLQKQVIRVCYAPLHYPIIFKKGVNPQGIAIDYLSQIQKIASLHIHYRSFDNWSRLKEHIEKKECDLVPILIKEPNAYHDYLTVSTPYIESHLVVITSQKTPYTNNLNDLKNKRIGIEKEHHSIKLLIQRLYPSIKLIELEDDNLEQIIEGKVDGIIASFNRASHLVSLERDEVKILTHITNKKVQGGFGIDKNNTTLLNIINKSLYAIPQETKNAILAKYNINPVEIQTVTNYLLTFQVALVLILIMFVIVFFYIKLRQRNVVIKQLNENLETRILQAIEEARKKDQMLQQQTKLAQMGEMISMIAHQWRQPLGAISNIVVNLQIKLLMHPDRETFDYYRLLQEEFKKIALLIQTLSSTIDD
ncbi:MAG: ABC transporter substrate-binding protein, partial [Campylobacterales bacterium]|nr:ABC transporter substrate-binding protein [Campylobacterales bacterium]